MIKPATRVIRPEGIPPAEAFGDGNILKTAHHFSVHFLQSADLFTSLSEGCEEDYSDSASREIKIEHRGYVTASIMLSWSFIEATINELYWATKHIGSFKGLSSEAVKALATISEDTKTLDRYQIALALAKKNLYRTDHPPYQDVNLLRLLRNKLIHYEPEWVSGEPQKIEKQLKGKFVLNPFVEKVKGSPFFPFKCLSHGCSEWAIKSALLFVDDFNSRLGVEPKYNIARTSLNLTLKQKGLEQAQRRFY